MTREDICIQLLLITGPLPWDKGRHRLDGEQLAGWRVERFKIALQLGIKAMETSATVIPNSESDRYWPYYPLPTVRDYEEWYMQHTEAQHDSR